MKSIILFLFFFAGNLFSQSLSLFDINTEEFPIVKGKYYLSDESGKQILNSSISDFTLTENDEKREIIHISCPDKQEANILSIVITIDVSGSMIGGMLDNAKSAVRKLIQKIPSNNTECAITTFNSSNYIIQDFTSKKDRLIEKVNSINAGGGTDFNAGFIDKMSGALLVAEKGKNKKIVIFVTDGFASGNEQIIIDKAISENIQVYNIVLNNPAPNILKNISEKTGAKCYENITSSNQLDEIVFEIYNISAGFTPCEIEWKSGLACEYYQNVKLEYITKNSSTGISYKNPETNKTKLEIESNIIVFNNTKIGEKYTDEMTLTALNGDVYISNIKINNEKFKLSGFTPNTLLKIGESITLTIEYECKQEEKEIGVIIIESDACIAKMCYLKANSENNNSSSSNLNLSNITVTHPNGNERFLVGSDTIVTWDYDDPLEHVIIDFSNNNGNSWTRLTHNAKEAKYNWNGLPNTPSDECLIRASVLERNPDGKLDYFMISAKDINSLDYNHIGTKIALGCNELGLVHYDVLEDKFELLISDPINNDCLVSYSNDGNYIAYGGSTLASNQSKYIYIWDVFKSRIHAKIPYKYMITNILEFVANDTKLIFRTGDYYKAISYDLYTHKLDTIDYLDGVRNIDYNQASSRIVLSNSSKEIKIIDYDSGKLIKYLDASKHTGNIRVVNFSPDGKYIVSTTYKEAIIWDVDNASVKRTIPILGNTAVNNNAQFSSDGKYVGIFHSDEHFRYHSVENGSVLLSIENDAYTIFDLSPDLAHVAFAIGHSEYFNIHNLITGNEVDETKDATYYPSEYTICHSGNIMAGEYRNRFVFWDLKTKKVIDEIAPGESLYNIHTTHSDFSSDCSKFVYTLSFLTDSIYVYNLSTGNYDLEFNKGFNSIDALCFSFDATKIYYGSPNRGINVLSINKKEIIKEIKLYIYLDYLVSSPKEDIFMAVDQDRKMIMYDVDNDQELFSIDLNDNQKNYHAEFSKDGDYLAADKNDSYARVWDSHSGSLIFEDKPFETNNSLNFIGYSPEGDKMAWQNRDSIAIYDAYTYQLIQKIKHPLDKYSWTKLHWLNGIQFITEEQFESPKLFDIRTEIPLAIDVSDTTFSIICPSLTYGADLNIGKILANTRVDKIFADYFKNEDDFPITITSLTSSNADFKILSPSVPFTLLPGEKKNLEISVNSSQTANISTTIEVTTQCENLQSEISCETVPPDLKVLSDYYDFGELWIGESKEVKEDLIKNISQNDVNITKIELAGPDNEQFTIDYPNTPFVLKANSSISMDLKFISKYFGRTCSDILFHYDGIGSPIKSQLFAEGIGEVVYIKSDTLKPGEKFNLELMSTGGRPEAMKTIIKKFKAKLRFQKTILSNTLENENISRKMINDSTELTIQGDINIENNVLFSVPSVAALGNVTNTVIEILEFDWIDKDGNILEYDTEFENGSLVLEGLCHEGGLRLFDSEGIARIESISPNPAEKTLNIEFSLIESGYTEIAIYNMLGEKVKTVLAEEVSSFDSRNREVNLDAIPSGQYMLIFKSPTVTETKQFVILK